LIPVHFGLLKLNDSILMMHREGGEAEYSAPCKWDNHAPYVAAQGNGVRDHRGALSSFGIHSASAQYSMYD
jgi:hypothetical protein